MATSYAKIQAKIAALQAQADKVKKSEVAGVIARVREAIAAYGLTAGDLGFKDAGTVTRKRANGAMRAVKKSIGVPKYRDPATGKTWTGRGKPPLWIVGKERTAFLIESASPETASPKTRKAAAARKGGGRRAARKA